MRELREPICPVVVTIAFGALVYGGRTEVVKQEQLQVVCDDLVRSGKFEMEYSDLEECSLLLSVTDWSFVLWHTEDWIKLHSPDVVMDVSRTVPEVARGVVNQWRIGAAKSKDGSVSELAGLLYNLAISDYTEGQVALIKESVQKLIEIQQGVVPISMLT